MLQDLTFGLRWLRKNPGFSLLAVLMLAVGIGVNTAMFSVINAVLLQPLPYVEADRVVWMNESGPEISNRFVSYPNFVDWRARNQVFESMSTFRGWFTNITGTDQPESINARMVTSDYFKVMRVSPFIGRDFTAEDDQPGAAPVTLISYATWQQRFAADPNVVGRELQLDDKAHTVIGVLPESFVHQGPPPLWVLMGPMNWKERDTRTGGNVIARLKPGVTIEQARADMNRVSTELLQIHPIANAGANVVNVLLGLVIGLGGAFVLTRLMSSLLFGVSTTDKTTFVVVAGVLMFVGVLACYLPARRATRVDPLEALRYE